MFCFFILDVTNLFHGSHGSPIWKTVSTEDLLFSTTMEQAGVRALASPAASDCQSLVLLTGPCYWVSASSSAKLIKACP